MWPDCSPPSDRSRAEHLLHHVLVADRRSGRDRCRARAAPARARCCSSPSRRSALPLSRPSRCSWRRAHQQHRVAVDDAAPMIDENRAVAVAVERDAMPDIRVRRPVRASTSGCVDPQSQVDVAAIRLVADDDGVEPEAREQRARHRRRRAVGAIDCQPDSPRRVRAPPETPRKMIEVRARRDRHAPTRAAHRRRGLHDGRRRSLRPRARRAR